MNEIEIEEIKSGTAVLDTMDDDRTTGNFLFLFFMREVDTPIIQIPY
jgi:hypothetical protein